MLERLILLRLMCFKNCLFDQKGILVVLHDNSNQTPHALFYATVLPMYLCVCVIVVVE